MTTAVVVENDLHLQEIFVGALNQCRQGERRLEVQTFEADQPALEYLSRNPAALVIWDLSTALIPLEQMQPPTQWMVICDYWGEVDERLNCQILVKPVTFRQLWKIAAQATGFPEPPAATWAGEAGLHAL